ncbi:SusD/RagB family nutrient-binding outer membrane lipoprotein [Bacteroides congonensis]|uniref:SusD/RagB family nutrient-binding outer membrane lipoprotein n=1 Tax=Bacteroides TaxID=816 RepID=UPI00189AD881|nr:SusD/RagB family nutrient-binding outer membrane lipoprotein [Bacteroides congonensis]
MIKKSTIKLILVGGAIGVSACTNNYIDYNTNPYEATKDQMNADGYIWRSALVNMQGYVVPAEPNTLQYTDCLLGGTYGGYLGESKANDWNNRFSTYNPSQAWIGVLYNDIVPKVLPSLSQIEVNTTDEVPLAVAQVVKVAALHRITDTYGPIPYSQLGADGKLAAPFDSQQDVYTNMIKDLDNAINILTAKQTNTFNPDADKVYGGNVVKWVKFANSLKLRLAMRMVYTNYNVDGKTPQTIAEEAVKHEIGVMTSNDDNAMFTPNENPFYKTNYEYSDYRVAADIMSYMKGYQDPRMEKYFTKSTFTDKDYHGIRIGTGVLTDSEMSHSYSNMLTTLNSKLMWMNAAEVAFLEAEGALRGWDMKGGDAKSYYQKGITLSFEQWGANITDSYLTSQKVPQIYKDPAGTFSYTGSISDITVKWKEIGGFDEENLERIITQKWIANFPLGMESWAEFRRTGYPKLMEVDKNLGTDITKGKFARRLSYPQDEYRNNGDNMPKALEYLKGADKMSTHVWWDCNPRLTQE